jgi:hypothetical protein
MANKPKGWVKEPARHGLAAKGIKTSTKARSRGPTVEWHHSVQQKGKRLSEIYPEDFEGWGFTTLATVRGKHTIELKFNEDEDSMFFEVWEGDAFGEPIYDLGTALEVAKEYAEEGLEDDYV